MLCYVHLEYDAGAVVVGPNVSFLEPREKVRGSTDVLNKIEDVKHLRLAARNYLS